MSSKQATLTSLTLTEEDEIELIQKFRARKEAEVKKQEYFRKINESVTPLTTRNLYDMAIERGASIAKEAGWKQGFLLDFEGFVEYTTVFKSVFRGLCHYFSGSEKSPYPPNKGIILRGPTGCGKSVLLEIFGSNTRQSFVITSTEEIVRDYSKTGDGVIFKYANPRPTNRWDLYFQQKSVGTCFDDLGTEGYGNRFGKTNVMLEVLSELYRENRGRYHYFHATTNAGEQQLIEAYDARIVSRLQEMFTIIELPENAPDFRKMYA